MDNFTEKKKDKWLLIVSTVVLTVLAGLLLFASLKEAIARLSYELEEIINYDDTLYYNVGKGMASGLVPYSGMYENKPPMIFLLAFISYKLTGGFYLCNICSFLAFLSMLILPLAYGILKVIRGHKDLLYSGLTMIYLMSFSLFLMMYAEDRSAEVQVEAFGASSLIFYFAFLDLVDSKKARWYSPLVILSGVFLGISVMFKEPFLLVGVFSSLFFIRNKKDWLYRFLLPLVYGGISAVIILLATRCFVPYFTIYIAHMFGGQLSTYGSPLSRMWNINKIFSDVNSFSFALISLIFFSMAANMIFDGGRFYSPIRSKDLIYRLLSFIKVPLALLLSSFSVGMGGQYYNHHFVFAVPFYFALAFELTGNISDFDFNFLSGLSSKENSINWKSIFYYPICLILIFLSVTSDVGFLTKTTYQASTTNHQTVVRLKEDAEWWDRVMDESGEEKYLWIGFNGFIPITYTKHLALGPIFVQDPINFTVKDGFIPETFMQELKEADIILYARNNTGVYQLNTSQYLDTYFTDTVPSKFYDVFKDKPSDYENNNWIPYFRTEVFF